MKRILILAVIFQSVLSTAVQAHHDKKYLVTGSYELSQPGSWHVLFATEVGNHFSKRSYGFEPGILYGINDRLDVELHSHHGIHDGEIHTEGIALESRLGLIGDFSNGEEKVSNGNVPFGMALLMEFEKGLQDHPDNYEGRVIAGIELSNYTIAGNLIWEQSSDGKGTLEPGYALGIKRNVIQELALGLEIDGNFEQINASKITPGVYISAAERFDLKLGASLRIDSFPEEPIVRLALVYGLE
ncbi:MAG: hypothetical protein HY033_13010 [Ignavibacteriae bacterium]|nr:hypothetical protein [Ignavibacteria bacterium]MBI3365812.1 hypothetical protein [Ignavibacteriota bacterium]